VASVNRGEYCVSKAGMSMMTPAVRRRLGEFGIPVYEIRPGIIRTDMTAAGRGQIRRQSPKRILLIQRRWGEPEDVGRAVAMLARGDLPYSTGQVIHGRRRVDACRTVGFGGRHANRQTERGAVGAQARHA
jgi:3-oxoacyl-[acyl-carrier protein] reductase